MVGASVCAPACGVTCCANVCHAVRVPVHVPPQDVHGRGDQGTGERGHDKAQARRRGRLGQGWYDVAAGDGRSPGARRRGPWCRGHQVRPLSFSPAAPRFGEASELVWGLGPLVPMPACPSGSLPAATPAPYVGILSGWHAPRRHSLCIKQ